MNQDGLGNELRNFLKALLATDKSDAGQWGEEVAASLEDPYMDPRNIKNLPNYIHAVTPQKPDPNDVVILPNVSAKLEPGNLLLTVMKDNSVHVYDRKTDSMTVVCKFVNTPMILWRALPAADQTFFCSMSGTRWPNYSAEVAFGQGGAIFHVDHRHETMRLVPGTDELLDPSELRWLPNGKLLVGDFGGFGGTGALYEIDPITGKRTELYSGPPLLEPVGADVHPDGSIYIANASMGYANPKSSTGEFVKDTGAILRLDPATRKLETIYDETSSPKGAICGIAFDDPEGKHLIIVRNDWPSHISSALLRLNLDTNKVDTIHSATTEHPAFYGSSPSVAMGTKLTDNLSYIVECYNKELLTFDAERAEVVKTRAVNDLLGPGRGMLHAMESVEFIATIK